MSGVYDLSKVRNTTKIKLVFMSIAIFIPIIIVTILTSINKKYGDVDKIVVEVLRYAITILGVLFILYKIVYYIRILKDDAYAETIIIKKNDERLIFLRQKYSTFSLKLLLFINLIGVIVSGFISAIVFYTLLVSMGVVIVVCLSTFIYYYKKY